MSDGGLKWVDGRNPFTMYKIKSSQCVCSCLAIVFANYTSIKLKEKTLKNNKSIQMFPLISDNILPCCPGLHSSSCLPSHRPSFTPAEPHSWPNHWQASHAGFRVYAHVIPFYQGKGFMPASAPSLAPSFQWHSQGRFLPTIQNSETTLRVDSSNQLSNISFTSQNSLLITKHHLLAF